MTKRRTYRPAPMKIIARGLPVASETFITLGRDGVATVFEFGTRVKRGHVKVDISGAERQRRYRRRFISDAIVAAINRTPSCGFTATSTGDGRVTMTPIFMPMPYHYDDRGYASVDA